MKHFKAEPTPLAERETRKGSFSKMSVPVSPHPAESETAAVCLGIFMGT